jgi:Cu+-exporting ATPase
MSTNNVTDPVCGMTIDPATAVGSSTHNGGTYYFCSRGCETKFDDAPEQFASDARASGACCANGSRN